MRSRAHTRPGLLATTVLLLGQGTALHHQHEIAADFPPGARIEHGVDGASPAPLRTDTVSEADPCPFCEWLSQGRSWAPSTAPALAAAPDVATSVSKPAELDAVTAPRGTPRTRAPPTLG